MLKTIGFFIYLLVAKSITSAAVGAVLFILRFFAKGVSVWRKLKRSVILGFAIRSLANGPTIIYLKETADQ